MTQLLKRHPRRTRCKDAACTDQAHGVCQRLTAHNYTPVNRFVRKERRRTGIIRRDEIAGPLMNGRSRHFEATVLAIVLRT